MQTNNEPIPIDIEAYTKSTQLIFHNFDFESLQREYQVNGQPFSFARFDIGIPVDLATGGPILSHSSLDKIDFQKIRGNVDISYSGDKRLLEMELHSFNDGNHNKIDGVSIPGTQWKEPYHDFSTKFSSFVVRADEAANWLTFKGTVADSLELVTFYDGPASNQNSDIMNLNAANMVTEIFKAGFRGSINSSREPTFII